jgi:hypothetical protein
MDDPQEKAELENGEPAKEQPRTPFKIKPRHMGVIPGLSYDNIERLLEIGEGEWHR